MIRLLTSFITLLLLNTFVFGQEPDSIVTKSDELSMITNRPGFTESTRAVFKSGFQIETGFQYSKDQFPRLGSGYWENILFPNLGLLYGVSKNVEVRVFANYEGNKLTYISIDPKYYYNLRGLTIGSKINLTQENGLVPEMALLISQGIPTNALNVKIWSTNVLLAWSYTLNPNFGLSGNLKYTRDSEFEESFDILNQDNLGYTINLGYAVTDNISVFAELFGEHRINDRSELDVNVVGGMGYRITPKFQIDTYAGYRVETEGFLINAGLSWLLLKE